MDQIQAKQKAAPLVEALLKYQERGYQPFHMPGHKGGSGVLKEWFDYLGKEVFSLDLTEVEGLDDLHRPTGPISEAQKLAADLMGADRAFFLINGVTVGIQSVIMSLCTSGDKIILPRHAHRSIYEAIILSGAEPVYLKPTVSKEWGMPIGVGKEQVEEVLNKHKDAKCLVMVHPTYQGLASDLASIGRAAREQGIPLIVDEAHGAHFKFSSHFPQSALECGACAAIQGWHKTMGSFTQSGMLLIGNEFSGVEEYLTLLQSTSPSYLLMGSLDAARRQWAEKGPEMAEKILELSWNFRNKVSQLKGIFCFDRERFTSPVLASIDPCKLLINAWDLGLSGFELAQVLRESYQIQPEMASMEGVLLMVTVGDNQERMDYLFTALKDVAASFSGKRFSGFNPGWLREGEMVLLPGEAVKSLKKTIKLDEAKDAVSGEFICPYPPGIPLVVPGERITEDVLEMVQQIKGWGGHIQGPQDPTGHNLRIID